MINEQTLVFDRDSNTNEEKKKRMNSILGKVGIGLAGAGAGVAAAMAFTSFAAPNAPVTNASVSGTKPDTTDNNTSTAESKPIEKPEISDEPKEATTVNDNMDFGHAFHAARIEVGSGGFFVWHGKVYGTQYAEEQSKLTPAEHKELYANIMTQFQTNHHLTPGQVSHNENIAHLHGAEPRLIIVHDEAPHATPITNDMSFKDAFALARAEVGPGGIFDWHGKHYNTYTREELSEMSPTDKSAFVASVGRFEIHNMSASDTNATVSEKEIDIVTIDHGSDVVHTDMHNAAEIPQAPATDITDTVITDKVVTLDDGSTARVQLAEVDGKMVMRIDAENDGNFDLDISANENGTYHLQAGNEYVDVTPQQFDELMGIEPTGGYEPEAPHFSHNDNAPGNYDINSFENIA